MGDLRCSECNRDYRDTPCGFLHSLMRVQIEGLRVMTLRLTEHFNRAAGELRLAGSVQQRKEQQ